MTAAPWRLQQHYVKDAAPHRDGAHDRELEFGPPPAILQARGRG